MKLPHHVGHTLQSTAEGRNDALMIIHSLLEHGAGEDLIRTVLLHRNGTPSSTPAAAPLPPPRGGRQRRPTNNNNGKNMQICFDFLRDRCSRKDCRFVHLDPNAVLRAADMIKSSRAHHANVHDAHDDGQYSPPPALLLTHTHSSPELPTAQVLTTSSAARVFVVDSGATAHIVTSHLLACQSDTRSCERRRVRLSELSCVSFITSWQLGPFFQLSDDCLLPLCYCNFV